MRIEPAGLRTVKQFFVVTALLELGAGLLLLVAPALVVNLLFGPAGIPAANAIGRLAGSALVSLGAACWWARNDGASGASRGLLSAMLIYNLAVVALVLSGVLGSLSPLLLAVVVVHGAMAVWSVSSLQLSR